MCIRDSSEIPGLGPKRVQALLKHFGSVARLREASPDAIAGAPGVGPELAVIIHERLSEHSSGAKLDRGDEGALRREDTP